jgi:adenine-specific DNA methylase
MTQRRKRLIEVAFPLEEVSEHSRREKNVRHGHISTLHIWWARRPLAACRAFIYESLVDDPETEAEREELLKEVADLASWDAVRKPDTVVRQRDKGGSGRTGRDLLERARARILRDNGGKPPRLLDPFAGGGAIPLEALRLGCDVEASDLNPVAVIILKGTVEYPQKYGRPLAEQRERRPGDCAGVDGQVPAYIREAAKGAQATFAVSDAVAAYEKNPLAADVRYWGNWMLEKARVELAQFYPPDPDGSVTVAYLWSRTVTCPNCGAEMPLIRQYWLARKDKKKVALKPVIDHETKRVDFEVVEGEDVTGDPSEATTALGDIICLTCRQVAKGDAVRSSAKAGRMGAILTGVVLASVSREGKRYRIDCRADVEAYESAAAALHDLEQDSTRDLPAVPDEPMPSRANVTGGVVSAFGLDTFGKLFNSRQLLMLSTMARLVGDSHRQMLGSGLRQSYAQAVATFLGFALDRMADMSSTLCRWESTAEATRGTFGRQAMPMVWDYAEGSYINHLGASWPEFVERTLSMFDILGVGVSSAAVSQHDATNIEISSNIVVTDPPYYDSINYADMSDFFYVWCKRSLGGIYPELLRLPLTA